MNETPAITFAPLDTPPAGTVICLAGKNAALSSTLETLNTQTEGLVLRAIRVSDFKGAKKTAFSLLAPSEAIDRLIVVGVGDMSDYKEYDWLSLGGILRSKLPGNVAKLGIWLEAPARGAAAALAANIGSVALGLRLRSYEFKKYKTKKKSADGNNSDNDASNSGESKLKEIVIHCAEPDTARAQFAALEPLADGVDFARDLVNEPANVLGPAEFAKRAEALGEYGIEIDVLDEQRMTDLGMGALLAVGQGSERKSYLVAMRWRGASEAGQGQDKSAAPLAIVGKGVCFDTGGISIKPAQGMEEMKGDMAGAACVTGLMLALAKRKAPVDVVGIIGLTENMPSGTAQRPGDIVTSMSGQTIEVLNTDAEGRLALADAMWYAQETYKPHLVITVATLTGAIMVALGKEYAGLYANQDELAAHLVEAGMETGDKVWRMPLGKPYDKELDSKIADMKNIGGRWGGSITAAQFLQRFVQDGMNWAHIDLAGTAMAAPKTDINASWGSGFGVRLLDRLIDRHYQSGGER